MISIFNKSRGFTLIELMVVVVVIAVLSALAVPAYQDYVIRAKITQAISGLSSRQVKMEQCYQDNRTYTPAGGCDACFAFTGDDFAFSCDNLTATTFRLIATGRGAMAGFRYTVDQTDMKQSLIQSSGSPGWNGQDICWITKKGGICG
jgi:type IV pilus assembly protein PilE